MPITYDPEKRRLTLVHRGLDFEDAVQIFAGVHFTREDDRVDYGEIREISIGMIDDSVVVVVWTERDATRRIIFDEEGG